MNVRDRDMKENTEYIALYVISYCGSNEIGCIVEN